MNNETKYYANVTEASLEHYKLINIFYNSAKLQTATSTSELSQRIVLVKYGTEPDQLIDELLIPREQVTSISELSQNSPILQAIINYLAEN